ncbi:MAG TPA: aldo/keto reductase [Ruminococcus flavefaciens]|nr:aldo/keto reductase [Ruminococcus flavefaciens]
MNDIKAVIGTNSWGGKVYGKLLRGSCVEDSVIREAMNEAEKLGLKMYDLARDYGLGKAQKMIGEFGTDNILLSAKFTPTGRYKSNCVRKSLEKDLSDFRRNYVDIYWLHLPVDIEKHLEEMSELYKEGKIRNIGVSNFDLEECRLAKKCLKRTASPFTEFRTITASLPVNGKRTDSWTGAGKTISHSGHGQCLKKDS